LEKLVHEPRLAHEKSLGRELVHEKVICSGSLSFSHEQKLFMEKRLVQEQKVFFVKISDQLRRVMKYVG
jgi:hypothetical protein